jgi:Sec7-like guanine-nucleotide exchange factor
VVEAKVRLVAEARGKLETLKTRFVSESSSKITNSVTKHLKAELSQLQEDIKAARENSFGRKIFEAFAGEFANTHLNENAEVRKLNKLVADKNQRLEEATQIVRKAKTLVESKNREIQMIKESNERDSTMEELLAPLNKEKQALMKNLLESVQTARLKGAFEKYLPAVLANTTARDRKVISESVREVTGDKTVKAVEEDRSNVIDIKRLAGLN